MTPHDAERALRADIGSFTHDPLGFVRYAFPWGKADSLLQDETGPREWQADVLRDIGEGLKRNANLSLQDVMQIAVASGHGIGKSALVSWILLWTLCTFEAAMAVVTANTEQQMRTKTWPQVMKWFGLLICRHWFGITNTAISAIGHEKTWRADRVTWSENNTEAFAGLHNRRKRIVLIFDEASSIADKVWEVAEGALTDEDTEIVWAVFGNPTQNTGRFRECFGSRKHRWITRQIDSRSVPGTNKAQLEKWVADYGDDSDFVRVRVKGEFPRAGTNQFIPSDIVDAAAKREATCNLSDALVLGVDVARHGDDRTVIYPRRGRDGRTYPPIKLRIPDLMQIAARVAEVARELGADAIFVDMGMGAGVVDRLAQLNVPGVIGVEFGGAPDRLAVPGEAREKYANKRAEMWGNMRGWLKYGAIPDDPELKADLIGPEYGFTGKDEIQLERKEDMKKRGLASPDDGDALALTFAYPVEKRAAHGSGPAGKVQSEYDPMEAA